MGLLSWLIRKGPVGNTAREIGDLYAQIRREQPYSTPESTVREVAFRYGWAAATDETRLMGLVCTVIGRKTGKDPRMEAFQDAEEIITDELIKRGVPTKLIQ